MSRTGGSKNVSNTNYVGSGIEYERSRIGGRVARFKAAAALKLGEVVYLSAAETVDKSTSTANHDKIVGIVVGGTNTYMQVIEDSTAYNVLTAADANEDVLVQTDGICYAIMAAAMATVGTRVVPDTATAGRVKAATALDVTVDAGGVAVTSSAANGAVATPTGDSFGFVVGKIIEASGGANEIKRILLRVQ